MKCPFCSAEDTRVVDSREADDGDAVRRRRECARCGERFTTYEHAELKMPQIIKSDGVRETFDEQKLLRHELIASGEREVPSRLIGELVMRELEDLDAVAYVRFASVYRSFQDLDAFSEEVERLQREPSAEDRRKQLKLIPDNKKSSS